MGVTTATFKCIKCLGDESPCILSVTEIRDLEIEVPFGCCYPLTGNENPEWKLMKVTEDKV